MTFSNDLNHDSLRISENLTIDHGRVFRGVPSIVLAPGSEVETAACFRWLREHGIEYVLRGTGHSSGGQALIHGGVMVDLRRLSGIVDDDPSRQQITVWGGTHWLDVCEHLAPQGRRPVALTTNARSTVGGTLAVGGFGDTTHIHGLQTASVVALTLITPDGAINRVERGEPLFEFALAGRGQLGAITQVTMKTLAASFRLVMRRVAWSGIGDFVRDALIISALGIYDFMRTRVFWQDGNTVEAVCARFTDEVVGPDFTEPGSEYLKPNEWTTVGEGDLLEDLRKDSSAQWTYGCPAVEIVLPLPSACGSWDDRINPCIKSEGIEHYLKHGAALVLTPRQAQPLAPVPDCNFSLMIALRPVVVAADAQSFIKPMQRIATEAISCGGRIYAMSVEPERKQMLEQYGAALKPWQELKSRLDPSNLCNPGLLREATSCLLFGTQPEPQQ